MSAGCRRSARIASSSKGGTESPAPQLASVIESVAESVQTSISQVNKPDATKSSPMAKPSTPSSVAPIKLPMSEMHPSKAHRTMASGPSSALRHGFTDINYNTTTTQTMMQNTPSKATVPSSDFTFRYVNGSPEKSLGPEAQRMMEDIRREAARIKEDLIANGGIESLAYDGRKIASAKGKSSRYSAAHLAEFKKMDSIEGHPSAFRAAPGRFTPVKETPVKAGIKRTQSKANLNDPESARSKTVPARPLGRPINSEAPESPSKRIRQRIEDDVSAHRPVSRDDTAIPRPKSSSISSFRPGIPRSQTHGSLATPTKSSLSRTKSLKTPTITLVNSPSQSRLPGTNRFTDKVVKSLELAPTAQTEKKSFEGLKRWAGSKNLGSGSNVPTQIQTPGRFDRVKSILKRHVSGTKGTPATKLSLPPASTGKSSIPGPPTTPGRKQVDFTPETKRVAAMRELQAQTPSPTKSSVPKSLSISKLPAPKFSAGGGKASNKTPGSGEISYPDLSAYLDDAKPETPTESVPGTFTFRSDHTINIDDSPSKGFGSAAGQATLRQVRDSTAAPKGMPGSFPRAPSSPSKEDPQPLKVIAHGMTNKKRHRAGPDEDEPAPMKGIAHGITNKKRHRAGSDEENQEPNPEPIKGIAHGMTNKKRHRAGPDEDEEDEGTKRGMKKARKGPAAVEGHAVVAPKLAGQLSPTKKLAGSTPHTPGSQKKKTGLSLSRLNMLARPKARK
ncbi:hypothetical protein GGS20DRAFT_526807 [Poronia punctata]|nr:hypothetical protein GGS20DRAFT_526807 [Poronia punctata]